MKALGVVLVVCILFQQNILVINSIGLPGGASAPNPLGGISVPIRSLPKPAHLRRDTAVTPPYKSSGGSYAIGLTIGKTTDTIYCNFDTGSFDLFVAGDDCTNCVEAPTEFSPSTDYTIQPCSSSFCTSHFPDNFCQSNVCKSNATYGDGSGITANIVLDRVGIPGLTNQAKVNFGSIIKEYSGTNGVTYLSEGQSGLIGAAYATGSRFPTNQGTVMDGIISANGLAAIFSLCVRDPDPFMSLGADFYNVDGFTYTPNVREVYYSIEVDDVVLKFSSGPTSLGLTSSEYTAGEVIVDSGTSLFLLDTNVFSTFYETLLSACTNGINLVGICGVSQSNSIFYRSYALTSSQISAYPTYSMKVPCSTSECNTLDLPPQYYLLPTASSGFYRAYIIDSGSTGTILGDIWMNNFHVVFDKKRNEIGFAPQSTCNLSGAKLNAGGRLCPGMMGYMPNSVQDYFTDRAV